MKEAYEKGAAAAQAAFGINGRRGMPDGPEHLGAEWLTRVLRKDNETYNPTRDTSPYKRLERPTRWGPAANAESSDSRDNQPGVGTFGSA